MGCAQTDTGKTGVSLIPIVQKLLQAGGARRPDLARGEEVRRQLHDYAERGRASFNQAQYLVLDEADRMLEHGPWTLDPGP